MGKRDPGREESTFLCAPDPIGQLRRHSAGTVEGKGPLSARPSPAGPHLGFQPTSGPWTARSTWKQQRPGARLECSTPECNCELDGERADGRKDRGSPLRAPRRHAPRSDAGTRKDVPGAAHKPRGAAAPARGRIGARVAGAAGAAAGARAETQVRALRRQPHPSAREKPARPAPVRPWDSGSRPPRRSL